VISDQIGLIWGKVIPKPVSIGIEESQNMMVIIGQVILVWFATNQGLVKYKALFGMPPHRLIDRL